MPAGIRMPRHFQGLSGAYNMQRRKTMEKSSACTDRYTLHLCAFILSFIVLDFFLLFHGNANVLHLMPVIALLSVLMRKIDPFEMITTHTSRQKAIVYSEWFCAPPPPFLTLTLTPTLIYRREHVRFEKIETVLLVWTESENEVTSN